MCGIGFLVPTFRDERSPLPAGFNEWVDSISVKRPIEPRIYSKILAQSAAIKERSMCLVGDKCAQLPFGAAESHEKQTLFGVTQCDVVVTDRTSSF